MLGMLRAESRADNNTETGEFLRSSSIGSAARVSKYWVQRPPLKRHQGIRTGNPHV